MMKERVVRINAFFAALRKHWFIGLIILVIGTFGGVMGDKLAEKILAATFPSYFEDETKDILIHQKKNFDKIEGSLEKLSRSLKEKEAKELVNDITNTIQESAAQSLALQMSLEAIKKENLRLREMLQEKQGIDGGSDFRLPDRGGIKIDEQVSLGVDLYYTSGLQVRLSGVRRDQSERLKSGDSIRFEDSLGRACKVTYLGHHSKMNHFSKSCKT